MFSKVLALSRTIAFNEIGSSPNDATALHKGALSVRMVVNTLHTAATPIREQVQAVASFLKQEG